jgi:hypothetical protein
MPMSFSPFKGEVGRGMEYARSQSSALRHPRFPLPFLVSHIR